MAHTAPLAAISRRGFLQSALIAAPLVAGLRRRAGAAAFGRPLLLVCDRLSAGIDLRRLRTFLDPFAALKLKLGLVLSGGAAELAPLARACAPRDPDLVEWIIEHPGVVDDSAYFQMRQASSAQNGFAAFRAQCGPDAAAWGSCLTLSCPLPTGAVPALDGVRAAGFRNVLLRPPADTRIDCWTTDNGVLQMIGGRRASLSYLEPLFAALTEGGEASDPLLVYLALDELAGFSETTLSTIGSTLAELITVGMDDGAIWPMRPSEFHLDKFGAERLLGLHFEVAGGAGAAMPPIMQTLAAVGVPFSVSGIADGDAGPDCMQLPGAPTDADWERLKSMLIGGLEAGQDDLAAPQTCVLSDARAADLAPALARTGAGVITPIGAGAAQPVGLDNAGLLHIPASVELGASATTFEPRHADVALYHGNGRLRDGLIVVRMDAANARPTPLADNWLLNLADGADTVAVGLPALAHAIAPADPVFALLRRATAEAFVAGPGTGTVEPAERAALLEDAQLAWRYFSRLSDARTGLASSSVQSDGANLTTYPLVTMWEIGSQILATVAALRIGIIDEPGFRAQVDRLLKSIPAVRIGGLRLPPANVSIHGDPQSVTRFSASDTGRLLVALKVLEREFDMGREVARIVARWDLAKLIADRRLHNVENGELRVYANSNYVDYTARGFALFGLQTRSPYDIETAETGTDRQMRLLNRVADLGPIATEPHVVEELELGHSEASRLIADLLFAAQRAAAQATGRLFCVSEAPLDRAPWFTYQGFQLGPEAEPWTVETKLQSPVFETEAARAPVRLVSTKGAFAWAAVRPHPYSSKLLAAARAAARIPDIGFASGIYAATGRPTRNYSDTNTNAVILEAIAYTLTGRRPALRPQ